MSCIALCVFVTHKPRNKLIAELTLFYATSISCKLHCRFHGYERSNLPVVNKVYLPWQFFFPTSFAFEFCISFTVVNLSIVSNFLKQETKDRLYIFGFRSNSH